MEAVFAGPDLSTQGIGLAYLELKIAALEFAVQPLEGRDHRRSFRFLLFILGRHCLPHRLVASMV